MRKLRLRIVYILLFVCFSAVTYFGISKLFDIREIRVVGGNIKVSVNEERLPRSLIFFPSDKLRKEILHDNPILADLRFEKSYPHTLVIIPTLRPAAALLITPSRQVLVDSRGIVLADADRRISGLPEIFVSITSLRIGQSVNDGRVTQSLTFLGGLPVSVVIETITITDDGVIRARTGKLDILFTQDSNITSVIATLQTLLAGFRIKGTLPTIIDLRFDKPVITF